METKLYTAIDKNKWAIVTVMADSEADARDNIREQLVRPGRRGYLKEWIQGGERIKIKES